MERLLLGGETLGLEVENLKRLVISRVDNSGYVYVLDMNYTNYGYYPISYNRIQKFTSDGQFVFEMGRSFVICLLAMAAKNPDGDGPLASWVMVSFVILPA